MGCSSCWCKLCLYRVNILGVHGLLVHPTPSKWHFSSLVWGGCPQRKETLSNWHFFWGCVGQPNQQRILNRLPPELRCRNSVNEHRLSIQSRRQACKYVHAMCTYSNWASILHATIGGWDAGFRCSLFFLPPSTFLLASWVLEHESVLVSNPAF